MSFRDCALTPDQMEKEKAVFWAIVLDTIILAFFTITGLLSGSMTALSEIIRFMLLLTIEYVSYAVLKRAHRGRFNEFEYGTGKIERITNLMVAFGLLLSSLYILSKIFSSNDGAPISMNCLILTILSATINLMANYYFSISFIRSNRTEASMIISSQIAARIAKTVSSAVVLCVLMLTLWLPDPRSARIVDLIGSIFLVTYMIYIAYELIRESLPEILDRTIPEPEHYQLLKILAKNFDQYDGFNGYKARRSGKDLFILLSLNFLPNRTIEQIEKRLLPIRQAIDSEIPGSTVTIESKIMS
ncbi:cation diffusion facilitator family transporter [Maridesulfovibrio ferrireducens]|uniref:Cation diffusion facilitator family transporter n=1 Tax=Maridesulfovibrio ferrireducens TaxID=246191 RepID=A0A1G9CW30_9BACT|nr:cation transporter [Maridesulfovibrio ferrireducens]SDK55847.1 cation diffusion facilitator family transporter [Maridesulfovibrio ferrireducens]